MPALEEGLAKSRLEPCTKYSYCVWAHEASSYFIHFGLLKTIITQRKSWSRVENLYITRIAALNFQSISTKQALLKRTIQSLSDGRW